MVKSAVPLIWADPPPPERDRLSRPAIVRAAMSVADTHGIAGLTMSAVARSLGDYTAMALYRYVKSKDGLVDLMLDEAVGEIALPEAGSAGWRAPLRQLAMDSWTMAIRHPWYAQLVHTRPPLGPHTLRRTETGLTILNGAGVEAGEALSYLALLDRHVYAAAFAMSQEQAMLRLYGLDSAADVTAAIRQLNQAVTSGGDYPLLARWMQSPDGPTTEQQLTRGLDFLLDGIATALRRPRRKRTSASP